MDVRESLLVTLCGFGRITGDSEVNLSCRIQGNALIQPRVLEQLVSLRLGDYALIEIPGTETTGMVRRLSDFGIN